MTKMVHLFGGAATTTERSKELLGGKGSNLAEMASIGLPVPPGFTITTDVCTAYYANGEQYPAGLVQEVAAGIAHIEAITGKRFGDATDPLLVSVRSGARVSVARRRGHAPTTAVACTVCMTRRSVWCAMHHSLHGASVCMIDDVWPGYSYGSADRSPCSNRMHATAVLVE